MYGGWWGAAVPRLEWVKVARFKGVVDAYAKSVCVGGGSLYVVGWAGGRGVVERRELSGEVVRRVFLDFRVDDCLVLGAWLYAVGERVARLSLDLEVSVQKKVDVWTYSAASDGEFIYVVGWDKVYKLDRELKVVGKAQLSGILLSVGFNAALGELWVVGQVKSGGRLGGVLYRLSPSLELRGSAVVDSPLYAVAFDGVGNGYGVFPWCNADEDKSCLGRHGVLYKFSRRGDLVARRDFSEFFPDRVAYASGYVLATGSVRRGGALGYVLRVFDERLQDLGEVELGSGKFCKLTGRLSVSGGVLYATACAAEGDLASWVVAAARLWGDVQVGGDTTVVRSSGGETLVRASSLPRVGWRDVVERVARSPSVVAAPFVLEGPFLLDEVKNCRCLDCPQLSTTCYSVGCGASGCVYKCGGVAVKIANPSYVTPPSIVKVLASVKSPNILRLYHVCSSPPAYVMELAESSLARFKSGRVVEALIQVLEGLRVLHSLGLAHRDVKPSNLLVVGGVVKIGDFDSAASAFDSAEGETLCTPPYCPPEFYYQRLLKESLESGHLQKWDIYQVGNVALFLLGQEPLDGAHWSQEKLEEKIAAVPPDLRELVASMLQLEPWERPTAEEAIKELARKIESLVAV